MGIEHSRNPRKPEKDSLSDNNGSNGKGPEKEGQPIERGSHATNRIERYDVNLNSSFTHDLDALLNEPELDAAIRKHLESTYPRARELKPPSQVKESTLKVFEKGALRNAQVMIESNGYDTAGISPRIYAVSAFANGHSKGRDRIYASPLTIYDGDGMARYVQSSTGIFPVAGEGRSLVEHISTTYRDGGKEKWWYYTVFLAKETFDQEMKNLDALCQSFTCGDTEREYCFLLEMALEDMQHLFDTECENEYDAHQAISELLEDVQRCKEDPESFRISMHDREFYFKPELSEDLVLEMNFLAHS